MGRLLFLLFLLSTPLDSVHVDLPAPFNDDCILEDGKNLYDPSGQFNVPWYNIDLDMPASERWKDVATIYAKNINDLLDVIKNLLVPSMPDILPIIDEVFGEMCDKIPQPYRDEIESISKYSGIKLGEIVMYNIFYELFTVCTFIVATDMDGKMYHARNLDFGLFLGWNSTIHEWEVSAVLRRMVININWIKNGTIKNSHGTGKVLYKSNNFAVFVGIYNGLRPNAFTITANERFMAEGGFVGIFRWMLGLEPNGKWMSWLTREALARCTTYDEAKDHLMNTPMLSPVYYILGGTKPFEGSIITRSLDKTDILSEMNKNDPDGWYLLQTNYDPLTEPLYLDDRQTPGDNCMTFLTRRNAHFQGMYNVLSSRTNLNKLTTYTVLMQFETHLQSCPGMCWPF